MHKKSGVDYNETSAPMALIALAAKEREIVSARCKFCMSKSSIERRGIRREGIYIAQDIVWVETSSKSMVWGIDSYFAQCGFQKSISEATLYNKTKGTA